MTSRTGYIEVLYNKDGKPSEVDFQLEEESTVESDALGPDLLVSEITAAVQEMKINKAEGIDGIPGEFWKNLGQEGMKVLVDLCRKICYRDMAFRFHQGSGYTLAEESKCSGL
jgi:hypothetical protein